MWFMIQRLNPTNDTYLVNENSIKRISVGYRKFGPDQNENLYVIEYTDGETEPVGLNDPSYEEKQGVRILKIGELSSFKKDRNGELIQKLYQNGRRSYSLQGTPFVFGLRLGF